MKTVEESIIAAMDREGNDIDLIKYLPYILQDFWEMGTSSEEIIEIIKKHKNYYSNLTVLDLGSGKGTVSIKLASELKCNCFGIDAIDEFIAFSNNKAKELYVDNICKFEVNDIRERIKTLGKYDIIILGAIGSVLGDYYSTLLQLAPHLNNDGLIIVNDEYVEEDNKDYPNLIQKNDILIQINKARMEVIDSITNDDSRKINEGHETQYKNLQKRCMELIEKYPEKRNIFLEYIEKQKMEYEILANEIISVILVIKQNQ